MRAKFLIDTVILIDHLNGIEASTSWLNGLTEGEAVISVITLTEALTGATKEEKPIIERLLNGFQCLPVEEPVARIAADLRQINKWRLPDA